MNQRADQSPSRMVINFHDWPIEKVKGYPECFERIESLVFPQRKKVKRKAYREKWWQYAERQANLLERTSKLKKVLVKAKTSKTWAFGFIEPDIIYSTAVIGFVFEDFLHYAVLQSSIHQIWAEKYASTLKSDMAYTPTDCFENFPFPELRDTLIENGEEYYLFRREVMLTNQEGLTSTYNRFNNPKEKSADISRLRELHIEMDNAVAAAYGWGDLELGHGFHETPQGVRFTISEAARREVLARLLQLNHERYEEEVRQGLHDKDKKKAKEDKPTRQKPKKLAQPEGQMNLLAEPEVADEAEAGELVTPTPTAEIGSWDRCKCLACDKTVMGFSIAEHTQSEHQGKDPGYRKMGDNG